MGGEKTLKTTYIVETLSHHIALDQTDQSPFGKILFYIKQLINYLLKFSLRKFSLRKKGSRYSRFSARTIKIFIIFRNIFAIEPPNF